MLLDRNMAPPRGRYFTLLLWAATFAPVLGLSLGSRVVVTGGTGRTGRLVVDELLRSSTIDAATNQTVPRYGAVRVLVRDKKKAEDTLPVTNERLEVMVGDLGSAKDIQRAASGCDGTVWCATGFSDAAGSPLQKLRGLFGVAVRPKQSIDIAGIDQFSKALLEAGEESDGGRRLVMLSSAGVTRPSWSDEKKAQLENAADIPIVRLNPFDILNKKCEAEQILRDSGLPYSIVRPCGLNDDW